MATTFAAATIVPPTMLPLLVPAISTPSPLPRLGVAAGSVPMKLPDTTLPVAPVPLICTPAAVFKTIVLKPPIVLVDAPLISTPMTSPVIVLPSADVVPPTVLPLLEASIRTPLAVFPAIVLPLTVFIVAEAVICTPVALKSMTFEPLTELPETPLMSTPTPLPICCVAVESVPMKFPDTMLPVAPEPEISTPAVVFEPIVLKPPMVFVDAPLISTPMTSPVIVLPSAEVAPPTVLPLLEPSSSTPCVVLLVIVLPLTTFPAAALVMWIPVAFDWIVFA